MIRFAQIPSLSNGAELEFTNVSWEPKMLIGRLCFTGVSPPSKVVSLPCLVNLPSSSYPPKMTTKTTAQPCSITTFKAHCKVK